MMISCGDKEEDKTETHTVTFENIFYKHQVQIYDNTGSVKPLFGTIRLQPGEFQSLTYKCEDCPTFDFFYEISSIGNSTSCVCTDGIADYTIGGCPGTLGSDKLDHECKTCVSNTIGSTDKPCN